MYNVVIVDDEAIIVDGLVNEVDWEMYEYNVLYKTTSSKDALQFIENAKVDLLITDVSMPELDGLELIKKVKVIHPGISVLVISAYDHFDYVKTALRYGAENYLLKPIDQDELTESLSQIAGHMSERLSSSQNNLFPILSFHNNLTERWVKNNISNYDLMEKENILGINFNAQDFTVILFAIRDNMTEKMPVLYEIVLSGLTNQMTGHFYFENFSTLVCVVSREQIKNISTMDYVLGVRDLARIRGINVFACMGSSVNICFDVHISYQQAQAYLFMAKTKEPYVISEKICPNPISLEKIDEALADNAYGLVRELVDAFFFEDGKLAKEKAIAVSSCCIKHLGRDISGVLSHFPDLVKVLEYFPASAERDAYHQWTMSFLQQYTLAHSNLHQAMYPCVAMVLKMIRGFTERDISLKILAAKLNVSSSYLGHVFKQQTGVYFNDYLAKTRLEYAQKLLLSTDLKMSDIAQKAGFASQTYFNRNFRRFYGVSPIVYRREKSSQ